LKEQAMNTRSTLIYDDETLASYRESAPEPTLFALVERLVTRTRAQGLWDSTCIVVGEPTTDLLGFDPVTDPPDWAWRTEHVDHVELGLILDDFTWIILVPACGELASGG
jgi:hypothetical protein